MSTDSQQQGLQVVLDTPLLDYLMAHMLRVPQTFSVAREWVLPEYFNGPGETAYRLIWTAALGFYAEYNRLPTEEVLGSIVVSQIRMSPDFSQQLVDDTLSLLAYAFPPAFLEEDLVPAHATDIIRHFLIERKVATGLQTAFQPGVPTNSSAVPAIVETAYRQMQQFSSIRAYTRGEQVPMDWAEVSAPTIPTGVPILDTKMGGGTEPREVHVVLGPTGVGKTTLGMQIVCSMAALNLKAVTDRVEGAQRKLHAFISFEDEKRSMVVRALSFAATIDKTRLEQMQSYGELTRRGNLMPYEQQIFSGHQDPPGEYERMCDARAWINEYCEFADFSGRRVEGEPAKGYGGIAEIRQYLDMVTNATGLPLGVVAIDWAGRCVRRYISAKGGDIQRQQTTLLSEFVGDAFDQIAATFNCPVFIMHQLKGATGKSPTKQLTHHDAEGCSTFAVNAWFAFVLGNKDEKTHTCLFQVTKTRRGEADTGQICLINGRFSQIVGAGDRYKIDQLTNRIVRTSDAERVADQAAAEEQLEEPVPLPEPHRPRNNVDQGYLDG